MPHGHYFSCASGLYTWGCPGVPSGTHTTVGQRRDVPGKEPRPRWSQAALALNWYNCPEPAAEILAGARVGGGGGGWKGRLRGWSWCPRGNRCLLPSSLLPLKPLFGTLMLHPPATRSWSHSRFFHFPVLSYQIKASDFYFSLPFAGLKYTFFLPNPCCHHHPSNLTNSSLGS